MSRTHHEKNLSNATARDIVRHYVHELMNGFGIDPSDLSHDDCLQLIRALEKTKRELESVRRRGGVTIVTTDDRCITAYRFASFKAGVSDPKTHCRPITPNEVAFLRRRFEEGVARC